MAHFHELYVAKLVNEAQLNKDVVTPAASYKIVAQNIFQDAVNNLKALAAQYQKDVIEPFCDEYEVRFNADYSLLYTTYDWLVFIDKECTLNHKLLEYLTKGKVVDHTEYEVWEKYAEFLYQLPPNFEVRLKNILETLDYFNYLHEHHITLNMKSYTGKKPTTTNETTNP
jgi:hypothetical protein